MAKGGFPGGFNMNDLMKQARKMQDDIEKTKEALESMTVEAAVGGGVVKAVATGGMRIQDIIIDESVIDPEDPEMLRDLIISAVNESLRLADEMSQREMAKVTGGMGSIPGMR
ncbi:MAG: YbaB/EbfC family nucleoid-associated protein [Clostridiales bacterium]|nr:YbaB/EbfC family nucleoid-associated protein [Clostridiales bacterium]